MIFKTLSFNTGWMMRMELIILKTGSILESSGLMRFIERRNYERRCHSELVSESPDAKEKGIIIVHQCSLPD